VLKIGELHRAEFIDERGRPSLENLRDRDAVGDAKGKIQVGEAIAAAHGERTHGGSGTTRSSSPASRSTRSRRASRCSTVNTDPPGVAS
jgi:hypothetical protein